MDEAFTMEFSHSLKMIADLGDRELAFRMLLEYTGILEQAVSRAVYMAENGKQKVLNLWDAYDVLKPHDDAIYAGEPIVLNSQERAKLVEWLEYCERNKDTLRDFK